MTLHRDIYWVGRQWTVTGFGVQAIDQRLKGAFDIEIARLWDDDLAQRMHALAWLKADDFDKALDVARARFPEPPRKNLPLVESVLELIRPAISDPPKSETERIKTAPSLNARPDAAVPVPTAPPSKPLMSAVASAAPSRSPISVIKFGLSPGEPAVMDRSPAQAWPLALRIEHASAKFLPRWRVRH